MKIIELQAENYKRLKAVRIAPDGTLQVIGGNNGQGKTSVLDAIWAALGGADANKAAKKPIRDGEQKARVTIDLGELVVSRTWTANDKTSLKVTSKDGASFSSPQAMLDKLIGRFTFDPLAFTKLSARDQREQLLQLVELPFDPAELDATRTAIYDQRTEIGRERKSAAGHLDSLPVPPTDTPDEPVSVGDLIRVLEDASAAKEEHKRLDEQVDATAAMVEQLKSELHDVEQSLEAAKQRREQAAEAGIPSDEDIERMRANIDSVEAINRNVQNWQAREAAQRRFTTLDEQYTAKSDELAELDRQQAEGLAAASFPVQGLAFDDTGVTYDGVPFAQASSAEQIRVSMAMAMALNPELRVIRILDGSLLDDASMQLITEMAAQHDFQVLMERVGDRDDMAVIIEDGEVRD